MFVEVWNRILESNAFNFVVMLGIFAFIFKKINITSVMNNLRNDVASTLQRAEEEKSLAKKELSSAKKEVKNLDAELKEAVDIAKSRAVDVVKKIEDTTTSKIQSIEKNMNRMIEGEEKTVSTMLSKKCASQSVEKARQKIINLLKEKPELHEKYIQESLQDLDRINF